MKFILTILSFVISGICFSQNTLKTIYVPDIARDWAIATTTASVGASVPSTSLFTINGVHPAEVVITNDTTFSIRFASDFSRGASLSFSFAGGGALGGLSSVTARSVDNQITVGVVHNWTTSGHTGIYLPQDVSFNTTYSIDSGDIIVMNPGDYGTFDVMLMTGVRFVAKYSSTQDSVRFTYFNMREQTINSGLFGHPAMPTKNIKIRSTFSGYFGIGCFATGYIWFENLEIYNVSQGIQVKTVSDLHFPPYNLSRLNFQNLTTRYIDIHGTSEEAFYIGADVSAPLIPIHWTGFGLTVDSTGRDAYQYRNGDWVFLKNCTMNHIGFTHNTSQSHGFLFGTTTQGGYVENLVGTDVWGDGILANGYGTLTFKNCSVESLHNTVYIKNYDDHDEYHIGYLHVNFQCDNEFTCTDVLGYSLDARMDPAKTQMTLNEGTATIFNGMTYVEIWNGIVVNTGTPACTTIKQYISGFKKTGHNRPYNYN